MSSHLLTIIASCRTWGFVPFLWQTEVHSLLVKVLAIVLYSVKISSRVMKFFAKISDCQDWCLSCLKTKVTCLMLLVRWPKPVSNIYISGSVFLFSFCLSFIFPSAKSKLNLFNLILLGNPISRALLSCQLLIMLLWECFSWALSVTE